MSRAGAWLKEEQISTDRMEGRKGYWRLSTGSLPERTVQERCGQDCGLNRGSEKCQQGKFSYWK